MPRPTKCRRVCRAPETVAFFPGEGSRELTPVVLTVDEFETIRLMDLQGLSQAQCGQQMQIARTTVQKIYESAREKLARMLVEGRSLRIEGGDYRLCETWNPGCGRGCVRFAPQFEPIKGEMTMRIAVTYENGQIFQHFGHTEQFKLYDVQDGKILAAQVVDTNGSGLGALAGLLGGMKAEVLICGGIGGGARMALAEAGIQLYGGVSGSADAAVEALLAGNLDYNPDVQCNHHAHHGADHDCGSHSCGSHHCGGHQEI